MHFLSDIVQIKKEFQASWNIILAEILQDPEFESNLFLKEWTAFLLGQNIPNGKQTRALTTITVYRHLVQDRTPEMDFLSFVLGWISEIRQAFALMADDIMDGSILRRGEPCWYTKSNVGLSAVNDAFLLENLNWKLLYKYFNASENYLQLLTMFQASPQY